MHTTSTTQHPRLWLRWLLVLALWWASTSAMAHEIEHALEQHDDPTCALHLYAGHAGTAPAVTSAAVVIAAEAPAVTAHRVFVSVKRSYDYRVRAPPVSSTRITA